MSEETRNLINYHFKMLNEGSMAEILDTFSTEAIFESPAGVCADHAKIADLIAPTLLEPRPTFQLEKLDVHSENTVTCEAVRHIPVIDESQDTDTVAAFMKVPVNITFELEDQLITKCSVSPRD